MLTACIAIPILFSPIQIDNRCFWDAELRSTTLLPHTHALLREKLPRRDVPDDLLLIIVGRLKPDLERLPSSTIEGRARSMRLMRTGKTSITV